MKTTEFKHFTNLFPIYICKDIDTMLVLGGGKLRYELLIPTKHILNIDWCDYLLQEAKEKENVMVLKYDIENICSILADKSFDVVVMFDFIEHLEKDKALELLKKLEAKVKKQIILFTPIQNDLGYTQEEVLRLQAERKENNSPLGYHLSLWTPEEFESLGYEGEYNPTYHKVKGFGAVFCVKNLDL